VVAIDWLQKMLWTGRIAAVLLVLMAVSASARAQEPARFALLIGNQNYDSTVGVLKNPHNDIALVGEALAKQGYEVLPAIKDARRSVIFGGVRDLVRRLNGAGAGAIGFVYYSGHGAAEKDTNINYLIPVDVKEPGTSTFWDESIRLDDILKLLEGARSAAKFVVFDACRSELQLPIKETTKGLLPVLEQQGMFIAYASAPGRTASDRGAKSGPYAAALAAELGKQGLDHLNLFQNVKENVLAATGGAQQPWESNGLGRRVYPTGKLKEAAPKQPTVLDPAVLAQSLQQQLKRVGCDPGDIDGKWDEQSKRALAEFARVTGSSVASDRPSMEALDAVTVQRGRICVVSCGAGETEVNGKCVANAKPATKPAAAPKPNVGQQKATKNDEAGTQQKKMCWTEPGNVSPGAALVDCGDARARQRF
jgi:hypothetical protein